jgi:hypothetical protein
MAGFLYYSSGDQSPATAAKIAAWGLGYAFPRGSLANTAVMRGPDGRQGNVFADDKRQAGKTIGFYPGDQTWRKLPTVEGRPELWVGYWNDAKPGPEELKRSDALVAMGSVSMGEGCWWMIPTLTELDDDGAGECTLPGPEDIDEHGNFVVLPAVGEDAALWDLIHPVALALFGFSDAGEPSHDLCRQCAIALLKRNYVVDLTELAMLGAFYSDRRYKDAIVMSCRAKWLIDAVNSFAAEEKKTD